jgi:hypothetical protein
MVRPVWRVAPVNRRRDTYPTVSVRKQAAKYRRLDSFLTDTDLDGIPRLTDRQRKRLLRAVTFNRNVRNRDLAYAKRHQYRETAPAETVEIVSADLGEIRPGIDPVNMVSHRKVNATKRTVYDRTEPALNQKDGRVRDLNPCAIAKHTGPDPLGNVCPQRPVTIVPAAGVRYDRQLADRNWTPELERRRAQVRTENK